MPTIEASAGLRKVAQGPLNHPAPNVEGAAQTSAKVGKEITGRSHHRTLPQRA